MCRLSILGHRDRLAIDHFAGVSNIAREGVKILRVVDLVGGCIVGSAYRLEHVADVHCLEQPDGVFCLGDCVVQGVVVGAGAVQMDITAQVFERAVAAVVVRFPGAADADSAVGVCQDYVVEVGAVAQMCARSGLPSVCLITHCENSFRAVWM